MEADHYKTLFAGYDVVGLDYHADNPWDAISEFKEFFHRYRKGYDSIILIANSIGAYFSMCALNHERVDKAFFISPIVDMEKLILDMMEWADITKLVKVSREIYETYHRMERRERYLVERD